MGGCTEKVLEWFDYLRASAHPGCEVSCQGYRIGLHRRFVRASSKLTRQAVKKGVSCYKADRFVASLPRFLSVQLSLAVREFHTAGEERCEWGHGRGVCEPLMPDVVAPEVQQNDRSYIRELSGPTFDPLHKNFARWAVTRSTEYLKKSQDCQNWGVGACPGQYETTRYQ